MNSSEDATGKGSRRPRLTSPRLKPGVPAHDVILRWLERQRSNTARVSIAPHMILALVAYIKTREFFGIAEGLPPDPSEITPKFVAKVAEYIQELAAGDAINPEERSSGAMSASPAVSEDFSSERQVQAEPAGGEGGVPGETDDEFPSLPDKPRSGLEIAEAARAEFLRSQGYSIHDGEDD